MNKQTNMFDWNKAYFQSEDTSLRATYATMAVLASYADFRDRTCYPSQRTLARLTGLSTETIRRHIKQNIEARWLKKIRDGNSYTTTNKYLFVIPTPLTHEGSAEDLMATTPLADEGTPHPRGVTPLTDEGSTPLTSVGLTNQVTTKGTTQQSGSNTEPFGSVGVSSGLTALTEIPH